ncbi:hypothetical protein M0813_27802 [Anaeramoeba flamelloides]|uniref:Uncharacterized protein n=1 Tax=Anaeramoeba flamelloides TaxID=1746091 RepID=A0AAV8A7X7_9EUKA|nr:hypothetical protein M0812_01346 [Anaeramoeba flamelloides]KAJ6236415.1 hypothetical protein M0813_27802 [Anaeramoeba flamelloides]
MSNQQKNSTNNETGSPFGSSSLEFTKREVLLFGKPFKLIFLLLGLMVLMTFFGIKGLIFGFVFYFLGTFFNKRDESLLPTYNTNSSNTTTKGGSKKGIHTLKDLPQKPKTG